MLCFHIVKCNPFLSPPILSQDQNIAKKKQSKLPPHHDPIVTRSCTIEMSTSGTSPYEENAQEIALLKEQVADQRGPRIENENQPPIGQYRGHNILTQGNDQEIDPFKDKNPEFGICQVKSQVETLAEKFRIIEGSGAYGGVELDSLTNLPQVIVPTRTLRRIAPHSDKIGSCLFPFLCP